MLHAMARTEAEAHGDRQGPFWDVIEGRREPPQPPCCGLGAPNPSIPTLGQSSSRFTAREEFLNPAGQVQGGFLAAMLDDTLGPALVATLSDGEWGPLSA